MKAWVHDWIGRRGRRRSHALVDRIDRHIECGATILDVGPGGGWISEEIAKRKSAKVTLVDVTDFNFTELPIDIYDGTTLPYPDHAFDTVLLIYTLHHCSDPLRVLSEAVRVSARRLIIVEDTPHSRLSHLYVVLWDLLTNIPTFLIPPGMSMTLNFKTVEEWKRAFGSAGVRVTAEEPFNQDKRVRKVVFVVDKVGDAEVVQ